MKLCKDLEHIYQNEIKGGNSICFVSKWNGVMVIYLKNKMKRYSVSPNVELVEEKDYHFPFSESYYCAEHKCSIFGPLEEHPMEWYWRNRFKPLRSDLVATPDTIEIDDAAWAEFDDGIPTIIGFKDTYYINENRSWLYIINGLDTQNKE